MMGNPERTADVALDRRIAAAAERVRLFVRVRLGPALRARHEPEDVVQEALADALAGRDRFEDRGDGSLVRWLCRIAETTIRSLAEREGAAKRTPPGEAERLSRILRLVDDPATGPVTAADRAERHARLAASLEALPDDEREAVLARFFRGLTFAETADELGTSETTARRLVARGLRDLGEELR
jgi:RNA polymerase sigma-70 factor (ECF subfamily)